MTVFDTQFGEQAFPMLLEQFGEPVIYYPLAGGTRSFEAIVEREPPASYDAAGNVVLAEYRIRFLGSCKGGVKSNEIDTGGDQIAVIAEVGGDRLVKRTVLAKTSDDSGVVSILVK